MTSANEYADDRPMTNDQLTSHFVKFQMVLSP